MASITNYKIELDAEKVRKFGYQVAGHPGVLEADDGKIVMKPLDERELQFYEGSKACPEIQPFLATFHGHLKHTDRDVDNAEEPAEEKEYLCLENLVHGLKEPCVMDVKIGVRLWDIDATPAKRERTIKQANRTTTAELGVFITGMRVDGQPAVDRGWCAELTSATIMDALEMYFSAAEQRVSIGFRKQIARQFIKGMTDLMAVLEKTETRMYSSSLLLVYDASRQRHNDLLLANPAASRTSGSSEVAEDGAVTRLKAIDFAHSHWTPGQGRDDNYLAGVSKLIELFSTFA
ncbi:hypothetical protein H4S06_003922 [Coemansia sp. BCRC 34490]|nr:hypothetical protein H4S06_003922 [Coemansia sp. BCRC 34490]